MVPVPFNQRPNDDGLIIVDLSFDVTLKNYPTVAQLDRVQYLITFLNTVQRR